MGPHALSWSGRRLLCIGSSTRCTCFQRWCGVERAHKETQIAPRKIIIRWGLKLNVQTEVAYGIISRRMERTRGGESRNGERRKMHAPEYTKVRNHKQYSCTNKERSREAGSTWKARCHSCRGARRQESREEAQRAWGLGAQDSGL